MICRRPPSSEPYLPGTVFVLGLSQSNLPGTAFCQTVKDAELLIYLVDLSSLPLLWAVAPATHNGSEDAAQLF